MELYMFLKLPRHSLSWRGAITLPLLGEKAWQKLVKENREEGKQKNAADILKKVLGITLTDNFKKRLDFQYDNHA